ncbi:hypothetical protein AB1Y20_023203 [Prymnesium parvum]|uniref:CRAL-TRIO domain-containing protein n=1 Tax=Prymnesium parvum TaxID=97485 RepID=A0AB34JE02_PRYPA
MEALFPDSPEAERARFLRARNGNVDEAAAQLRTYLKWRAESYPPAPGTLLLGKGLPPWNLMGEGLAMRGVDGTPVLLSLAAMADPEVGTPAQYAYAAAMLLEENLPRDTEQLITIVVDVGGIHPGGANAPVSKLIPIIRELSRVLAPLFPERVKRMTIYPVPLAVRGIWSAVKLFLDPVTANKAVLLSGGNSRTGSRYPVELSKYVDMSNVPPGPLYGLPHPKDVGEPWRLKNQSTLDNACLKDEKVPQGTTPGSDGACPDAFQQVPA